MKKMLFAATILGLVLSLAVTLMAIVACLGMDPKASLAEVRLHRLWMLGFAGLYTASLGTGIGLLRRRQPGWAAGTSTVAMVVISSITMVTLLK